VRFGFFGACLLAWVPSTVLAQTIPRLAGNFEKLWTAPPGRSWLEGPAYDGAGGVWFTDLKDLSPSTPTDILRHDIATGTTVVMVHDSGGANGLAFDAQGRLLAALWHEGALTRVPLDPGEVQAIALAKELQAEAILIDERKGRRVANEHGLNAVGTLNVLEFAAERKLLELKPTLEALRRTTFYITDEYIDAALQRDSARRRHRRCRDMKPLRRRLSPRFDLFRSARTLELLHYLGWDVDFRK
jgi:hypothetical protein